MSQVEEIELSMAEAQKLVDRKDRVNKLMTNRDFNKIVIDGYFKDEAARLTALSADPALIEHRDEIILSIQGISLFQQYLRTAVMMGNTAEQEIAEAREHIADIEQYGEEE